MGVTQQDEGIDYTSIILWLIFSGRTSFMHLVDPLTEDHAVALADLK